MKEYYYILTYSSLLFIVSALYHKVLCGNNILFCLTGILSLISFINWKNLFYPKLIHFIDRSYVRILFFAALSVATQLDIFQIGLLINITFLYALSKYFYYKKNKIRVIFHTIFHLNALALSFTFCDSLVMSSISQWR